MKKKDRLTKKLIRRLQISYDLADRIVDTALEIGAERLKMTFGRLKTTEFIMTTKNR